MTKKKAFSYALAIGMFIAGLTVMGGKIFFPVWAAENLMLMIAVLGGITGLLCSVFIRWGQKKK